jgi:hypothetical protein
LRRQFFDLVSQRDPLRSDLRGGRLVSQPPESARQICQPVILSSGPSLMMIDVHALNSSTLSCLLASDRNRRQP